MDLDRFVKFVYAREAVRRAKEAGKPWPWTDDPILQKYRFCNVRRNDDKETRLIHTHWLHPNAADPDLWFAMTVARVVNWWPSLLPVGYPVPWNPNAFSLILEGRKAMGEKVFTGAYMVSTNGTVIDSKISYVADYLLTPAWAARAKLRPTREDSLDSFHRRLMHCNGLGSFMAAQVVADVKYAADNPLAKAEDWWTWAASGPGSRRGLNRVLGKPPSAPWTEAGWRAAFEELRVAVLPLLLKAKVGRLSGQDLQNCLCEYDKYERVRLGEGKPRSLYRPPSTTQPQENLA